MNRRKVLKTLAGLGAASTFPATAFTKMAAPADRPTELAPVGTADNQLESGPRPTIPRIGLIAVGGVGGEILSGLYGKVAHLYRAIAIDIHPGHLHHVKADRKIWADGGFGTDLSNNAKSQLDEAVDDLDLAFMVVGMGGATETFLAQQIAEVLQVKQITTFAAALMPFDFEGRSNEENFWNGFHGLYRRTTATFQVPLALRDPLFQRWSASTIGQLCRSIAAPLCESGFLGRFDLADFKLVLAGDGRAAMGYGSARGKNSATAATLQAIAHPLLGQARLKSASGVLVLVETSGAAFHMHDAIKVPPPIRNALTDSYDGHLLFGAFRTESLTDDFRVTILANGT